MWSSIHFTDGLYWWFDERGQQSVYSHALKEINGINRSIKLVTRSKKIIHWSSGNDY